jgi:transposase
MYASDVSQEEWQLIEPYFQPTDKRGAEPKHNKRDIVNAIFYLNKTGRQWRLLPSDFPPWQTIYDHYSNWNRRGIWEKALDALNELHRKKTAKTPPRVMALSTRRVSKPSPRANNGAMTVAKKRKAGNATS